MSRGSTCGFGRIVSRCHSGGRSRGESLSIRCPISSMLACPTTTFELSLTPWSAEINTSIRSSRSALSDWRGWQHHCPGRTTFGSVFLLNQMRPRGALTFLRRVPAAVRFISAEPLIGPIDRLNLDGIHWVITGGESGVKHRPCDPDWVREARDHCLAEDVAYFHKQWGGRTSKKGGRELDFRSDVGRDACGRPGRHNLSLPL